MDFQGGDAYRTAEFLVRKRRFSEALQIYLDLAKGGDAGAQAYVGWLYWEGKGTTVDKDKGLEWYRRSADSGSALGTFCCGKAAVSRGAWEEAIGWFKKGADQGYGPSLLWLGLVFVGGYGAPANLAQGVEYLERSAATGNYYAKREIALLMLRGKLGLAKIPAGLVSLVGSVSAAIAQAIRNRNTDKLLG